MKYLLLPGVLGSKSVNRDLLKHCEQYFENHILVSLAEFNIPLYNSDEETTSGIPEGVLKFGELIASVDGILIATPEYNYGISGVLKNAIDWVSRIRPMPLTGKSILLMSASPSPFGGLRGISQVRAPLEGLGNFVYPHTHHLSDAYNKIGTNGLNSIEESERLQKICANFSKFTKAIATQ